jgi:broad specificity phosphatase PhoE
MTVDLILVRHGRTAWNHKVRFRGRTDLPLDDVGQEQARAVSRAIQIRYPGANAIYSSPLLRARQTAAPVAAALGLEAQPHPGLLDVDYGEWTGLTTAEAESHDSERYRLWKSAPQQIRFPKGESLGLVQERIVHLLEELAMTHPSQQVVLVGHLVVNRVILCTLLGAGLQAFWKIRQDNAAINLAQYGDGTGQVLCLNDTCHLSEEPLRGGTHG